MIVIAFGTRPEWIKIKPVVDAIDGKIPFKLLFTGQHTSLIDSSMSNYVYESIKIEEGECDNRLDEIVCSILKQFGKRNNYPSSKWTRECSAVMVQGDTTSAFAVAMAAFHSKIPVIHLEAGLRTFDKYNPYPEEFNRTAISAMADIHLCPTATSVENIVRCSTDTSSVHLVGNTVLDALLGHPSKSEDFILVTLHRRENHDQIESWFKEIDKLAASSDLDFVLPIHPNPSVNKYRHILKHVKVIDPLPYASCIDMVSRCKFVITDSGGLQEESSFFGKRCIVCRKVTERVEGMGDFAFMCGDPSDLPLVFDFVCSSETDFVDLPCPYGDGKSAEKITEILNDFYTRS